MEPNRATGNRGRLLAGVALAVVLTGGGAAGYLLSRDDDAPVTTNAGNDDTPVLSAEEGAAARARMDQHRAGTAAGSAFAAEAKLSADAAIAIGCGPADGGEPYVPTAEELANANADTDALAATFDTYGITYNRVTDPQGFAYLEWDTYDVVAQSVQDSFWAQRYPVQPPTQADLDQVKRENDVIVRYLEEAGVVVTRTTDANGWETLDYDYDRPGAQEAVDAAYAELYPPVPPTPEELATAKADNDKLAAAFDAAGISYTRVTDALGWEWLEWDFEDPDTQAKVDAVYAELYPPVDMPCLAAEGEALSEAGAGVEDGSTGEAAVAPAEGTSTEPAVAGEETVVADDTVIVEGVTGEPTPEQVARRDTEATALVAGFAAAGVTHQLVGESPWQSVTFDLENPAAVTVVADVLATRAS